MPRPAPASSSCVGGMDPRREQRHAGRRAPTSSSARRAACATTSSAATSTSRRCAPWCSTRPTRCSTWAFARTSSSSSRRRRPSAARCCSRPPCPAGIAALAKRYQRDALRIDTAGERRARTATSSTAPCASRPTSVEHAVVNVLRYLRGAAARSCSATPARPCAICTPTCSSAASPPWRCPAS